MQIEHDRLKSEQPMSTTMFAISGQKLGQQIRVNKTMSKPEGH